jgi:hypothetical protein
VPIVDVPSYSVQISAEAPAHSFAAADRWLRATPREAAGVLLCSAWAICPSARLRTARYFPKAKLFHPRAHGLLVILEGDGRFGDALAMLQCGDQIPIGFLRPWNAIREAAGGSFRRWRAVITPAPKNSIADPRVEALAPTQRQHSLDKRNDGVACVEGAGTDPVLMDGKLVDRTPDAVAVAVVLLPLRPDDLSQLNTIRPRPRRPSQSRCSTGLYSLTIIRYQGPFCPK